MKKKTPAPKTRKKTTSFRSPRSRKCVLLDRKALTVERPNFKAGLSDRHDPNPDNSRWLSGHAPSNFHAKLILQREHPVLWIGIDPDPDVPNTVRTCFAIIGGETLRQLAEDVLRYYPAGRGAR